LAINYPLLSSWPDEFIPSQISLNIASLDGSDYHEREGYVADLETDNFENDFQIASDPTFSNTDAIFASGSVCSDINGERTNCDLQLLQTLNSVLQKDDSVTKDDSKINDLDTEIQFDNDFNTTSNMTDDNNTINSTENPSSKNSSNYIRYSLHRGSSTLASAWKDPLYFTTAFPTLFPKGLGGHLNDLPLKVSLEAFAQWALRHHSRR
jgi:hypothetical protein